MSISPALLGIFLILPRVKHGAGLLGRTFKYASFLRIRRPCIWTFLSSPQEIYFVGKLVRRNQ